jgi:hypothetical protein
MPKGKKKDPDNLPAFKMTTFHIPPQFVLDTRATSRGGGGRLKVAIALDATAD